MSFECAHHCGEWGTESIRSLEWQFVQCLYNAHEMSYYIAENHIKRRRGRSSSISYPDFVPIEIALSHSRPVNFSSKWYQKIINEHYFVYLSDGLPDRWGCTGSKIAYWQIQHIDNEKGAHIGKCFARTVEVEEIEYEDPDESGRWDFEDETVYKFGNFIDFHNACFALESDISRERNADQCRDYAISPHFKQQIETRYSKAHDSITELETSYQNIFVNCSREHNAPSAFYTLALLEFQKGEYTNAIDNLKILLDKVDLKELEASLASNIYTSEGEAEVEAALYDDAIPSLSKAIERNPLNKEAYFERAIAYFEKGDFDLSLKDYLASEKGFDLDSNQDSWEISQFALGITVGGARGLGEATAQFLPSICASVHGMGNLLWTTVSQPIEAPKQFAAATIEFCNFLRTSNKAELAEGLVPELYKLVVDWDDLSNRERGELAGYVLGKYGTDILLPVAALKGVKFVQAYHGIRKAEKLCTLETLAKSSKNKAALTEAAANWQEQRKIYFAKIQLEADKQSKHIVGSWNHEVEKSIWNHPEPETLLKKHAGKGQKVQGVFGEPGYRERVDFGETIGYFVNNKTNEKVPTTMGTIHYSKKGAHIVPAQPKK